jgi:hypothetical protein
MTATSHLVFVREVVVESVGCSPAPIRRCLS